MTSSTRYPTHRPVVMGTRGAVAAGHHLASLAGLEMLMHGGNAVDAAVASSAALGVLRPGMCGPGGDLFALVYSARTGEITAINASGAAPRLATPDVFADGGIPESGPLGVTVPSAVDGWAQLMDRYGSLGLERVLQPAIGYAERGFPVYHKLSDWIAEEQHELSRFPTSAAVYLPSGRVPRPGELLVQTDMARSLALIASQGPDTFYRGEIAQEIDRFCRENGGLLRAEDLAAHHSIWREPISTDYRGYKVYAQPPVSQAFVMVEALNIVEGFDLSTMAHNSAEYIHLLVEAIKQGFADRDRFLGDPDWSSVPMEALVSRSYADTRRASISLSRASTPIAGNPLGLGDDTTYLSVVDAEGNAVSMIQSLYESCRVVAGRAGFLLNNRLTWFSLEPGHPNFLHPGKRPIHTLTTYLMFRDKRLHAVLGTPGADAQVQTALQLVANLVDFGMNVQQAIEAPRWRWSKDALSVESRIPQDTRAQLEQMGHSLRAIDGWSPQVGGAQAILIDPESGAQLCGADPRRDGYALAW